MEDEHQDHGADDAPEPEPEAAGADTEDDGADDDAGLQDHEHDVHSIPPQVR